MPVSRAAELHVASSAELNPQRHTALLERLDVAERARHARLRTPALRWRYALGHALLRDALAARLRTTPVAIKIGRDERGRPRLVPPMQGLDFNLSYTAAMTACIVAGVDRVGLDIERIDPQLDWREVARRVLSPRESAVLTALSPGRAAERFFECWVLKEAYAKATGDGVAMPFAQITLLREGSAIDCDLASDTRSWSLRLYAHGHYRLAVCSTGALEIAWHSPQHDWHAVASHEHR